MNSDERKRQMFIAIRLMEELVADVLSEARGNEEEWLSADTVSERAGLPRLAPHAGQVATFVLKQMENKGQARNLAEPPLAGKWRIPG